MSSLDLVRAPAVAGAFYPASPAVLGSLVDRLLAGAREGGAALDASPTCPKAIIVPHAGYVYSGPIAASAFALLLPHADKISRIVLVGPAHRVYLEGVVSPGASRLRTPLGDVEVDTAALDRAHVVSSAVAHAEEHSLEVELPFLQRVAPHAKIVPLAVGHAPARMVASVLGALWDGPGTVFVISSDLSHYLPYEAGRAEDERTAARILALDASLSGDEACGAAGINGLLQVAREKGLRAELVDLRSSGDTAGSRDQVVGYGAFALYEVVS